MTSLNLSLRAIISRCVRATASIAVTRDVQAPIDCVSSPFSKEPQMRTYVIAAFVSLGLLAFAQRAKAQLEPDGEVTDDVGYVNGVPGTDFMPGDRIKVDAEGIAEVPSVWGETEQITLMVSLEDNEANIVEADSDVKWISPGTGDDFEVNGEEYLIDEMVYAPLYQGRINLYYTPDMENVILDGPYFVTFTTD